MRIPAFKVRAVILTLTLTLALAACGPEDLPLPSEQEDGAPVEANPPAHVAGDCDGGDAHAEDDAGVSSEEDAGVVSKVDAGAEDGGAAETDAGTSIDAGQSATLLGSGYTRESLLDERVGHGRFAGGTGNGDQDDALLWPEVVVTNLRDSGAGSLREAMSSGGRWVTFTPGLSGNLALSTEITIPSRIVVDGRGASINFPISGQDSVFSTQFTKAGVDNFIFAYLDFTLVPNAGEVDGIRNGTGQDVWFHHIAFHGISRDNTADGDGSIDSTPATSGGRKPDRVTISWSRFENWNKTMLCHRVGGSEGPLNDFSSFTLHHNLFRHNAQRNPRSQNARLHFFNNWLDGWGASNGSGNGVELFNETRFRHAGNIYSADRKTQAINSSATAGVSGRTDAVVKDDGGNVGENGATFSENRVGELDYTPGYPFTVDPAGAALKAALDAWAGNKQ